MAEPPDSSPSWGTVAGMARMDWMDTLRGGAVVGVVVLHAELGVVAATGEQLPAVHAVNHALGDIRMPLLVMLSGVLLPRSLAKGFASHLRGKLHHILWPYAVWATFDVTHALVDAAVLGRPMPWQLVGQLFYDPHTYLWFLAFLFCFHLLAGLASPLVRTLAVPVVFWAAGQVTDADAHKFVWLLAWFLVGDLAARMLTGRMPGPVVWASGHLRIAPLATVGRSSLVYYASHMLVLVYAIPLLHGLGLRDPQLLWAAGVATALLVGRGLAGVQHQPGWSWLFVWPRRGVAQVAGQTGTARAYEREKALVP
jgi:uncharacterized membrane protein YcfT